MPLSHDQNWWRFQLNKEGEAKSDDDDGAFNSDDEENSVGKEDDKNDKKDEDVSQG